MVSGAAIKGFQFTPTGIAGILKSHRLKVPPYQREYAWTVEEAQQLYDDFSRAKSENTDYFLGTIVTIRSDRGEPLEIVDGQQRLTTTALLIASIRDYLSELGKDRTLTDSISREYLATFDRKQRSNIARLILNIDDHAFFEAMINGAPIPPSRESHERLIAAGKTANKHVRAVARSFSDNDKPDILNDWLEFLEHSATVILVETQNGAQAFKMFETLNDRGLRTSQADLVKSYLFGQSGSRIQESQARWSSMKDNLEEIDDEDRAINFLRHATIATRRFVRAEDVYEFAQSVRGESNALSYLADLERLSRLYVATYRPSAAKWAGYPITATRALSTLNRFDIKPMRPLVLSLAAAIQDHEEFVRCITYLAALSVRLVVASSTRSGSAEMALASAALKTFKGEVTKLLELKDALKSVIVADADFEEAFRIARVSRADLARLRTH